MYKSTTLGTTQNLLSQAGSRLIKHLYETATKFFLVFSQDHTSLKKDLQLHVLVPFLKIKNV